MSPTYWMGVASADHVRAGRDGGFAQLGHGKHMAVKSLRRGDWIVYYAPRERMRDGAAVRAFTAIGQIISDMPYQVTQCRGFMPFRVDVAYLRDANPAPITPLLPYLDLTRDRAAHWGIAMRGPKTRLSVHDMRLIAKAMGVSSDFIAAGQGRRAD